MANKYENKKKELAGKHAVAELHKRHGQEQFSRLKKEGKDTSMIKSIERKTGKKIGLNI